MNATKLMTSFATAAVVAGSIGLAYAQSSDSTAAPGTDAVPTRPQAQPGTAPMRSPAMPADSTDFGEQSASATPSAAETSPATRLSAQQVLLTQDNQQRPFAVVDKKSASLSLYDGQGSLVGTTTVLLGQTPGDHSMPGVGARTQSGQLKPGDRTTPAGRFESEPGHNRGAEALVWIDYGKALAIHRLRPGPELERRAERMASVDVRDKRISAGCVVVPVAFYEAVVEPMLGRGAGVVYVLPEDEASPGLRQAFSGTRIAR